MEIIRGRIVRSAAGHDKGDFFVVLSFDGVHAMICDGKHRMLQKPKKKKFKHLFLTKTVLDETSMVSDRSIRRALREFVLRCSEQALQ